MSDLDGKWVGNVFGTNTGNLFLDISQDGDRIQGSARIADDRFGLTIYSVTGTAGDRLRFTLAPAHAAEGVKSGEVSVDATIDSQGRILGTWDSTIGTAGTFVASRHLGGSVGATSSFPDRVFTRSVPIGAVRLFRDDVEGLLSVTRSDFGTARPVVTYEQRGSRVSKFEESFLSETESTRPLDALSITIQEPEPSGINRTIAIELPRRGASELRVSGPNETWVAGKADALANAVAEFENAPVTLYRRYGLLANQIILFIMLIAIPEFPRWQERSLFVGLIFALLLFLALIYGKFIPNTRVIMGTSSPGALSRAWPSLLAWVIAASSSLAAMFVFWWFTQK